MIKLPGLIDTHVHLREPGATQKEDFETGTKAAIAGGFTTILDMPNNPEPTVTPGALSKKIQLTRNVTLNSFQGPQSEMPKQVRHDASSSRIFCDLGFHFGATEDSTKYFGQIKERVFGLKVYMNHTTGTLLQEDPEILEAIFSTWPSDKVIMVHAEGPTLEIAIQLAKKNNNKLHVCHVSLASEISLIKQAKLDGLSITCEVTCHHLFLTSDDAKRLGPFGMMRPPLASKLDQEALWAGIRDGAVDTIASDHAPHTKEEKNSPIPPNGVPGLETTLPLLLTAVSEGRLTVDDIIRLCHTNPAKIFCIDYSNNRSEVEVDMDESYTIDSSKLYTKCGWTPFEGMKVKGKVKSVFIRGTKVFENGKILSKKGSGKIIYPI